MNCVIYPDRDTWLAARANTIGCSDVAAICGVNPYKSAYTLWAQKMGKITPFDGNIATEVGLVLEPYISRKFEEATGIYLYDPGDFAVYAHNEFPWWTCTPDRVEITTGHGVFDSVVELKTIGEMAYQQLKSGEAPISYQVQLQAQMDVLGVGKGYLACLIGARNFEVFEFDRHDRLIAGLRKKVCEFHNLLLCGTPPPIDGSESTFDTLRELHPDDDGEQIECQELRDVAHDLKQIQAEIKAMEETEQALKSTIIATMGDHAFAYWYGGKASYKTQERNGSIKVDLSAQKQLDAAGIKYELTEGSKFRVLRITMKG